MRASVETKKPESKLCVNQGNGAVCMTTIPSCDPPNALICDSNGCACLAPPPRACEAHIVYPAGAPDQAQVVTSSSYCDAAGLEIAIAAALTKFLQRP
jgi:hypothetical protein